MAEIAAKDVASLRRATGAGMMDCKKALEESGGDLEAAMDWLRVKGLGKAGNLAEREANEGAVDVVVDGGVGAIVELTCNTDFVAKSAEFTDTVAELAALAATSGTDDIAGLPFRGATVAETLSQMAAKVGENVGLGRVARFETADGLLDGYKHLQTGRGVIGVLVELGGVDPADAAAREVAHEIALHLSWTAPGFLTRDEVPADVVERERAVMEEKSRSEGIPEAKLAGAVQGRLNAFFKEVVLLEQPTTKDPKVSVAKLVETLGSGATVRRFARIKVGGE